MYLVYLFVVLFLVCIDQYSKQVIVTYISLAEKREVIPDFFYITNVRNTGAAWSLFEGQKYLFVVITIGAIIGFSYLLLKDSKQPLINKVSYLLIIGGAIGNLIDRVINAYVVDFLDFYIFGYDFPVFNLADVFLTVGVGLYLLSILLEYKHAKN